jgi:copper ion binding protein
MKELIIGVEGMSCNHCKNAVESEIKELDGVENAEVNLTDKNVKVFLNTDVEIKKLYEAIEEAGFEAVKN